MFRPTAGCIWNSFRISGKRHLILTGDRGSGKTTLLNGILPLVEPALSLTTWAKPRCAVYLSDGIREQPVRIGRFDPDLPGPENRMRPLTDNFRTYGVEMLHRCAAAAEEWVTIDEIGYLETTCPEYCAAILDLMDQKQVVAVVRKQNLPFLHSLCRRRDAFVVDLDHPFGQAGCVVMASGLGKRFGGNKLMAGLNGKPLIQYALDATAGIFADRIVVTRHPDVAELCRRQGVDVLLHDRPYRSDTVRLGLETLGSRTDMTGCLFCPADQPLLQQQTVATLAVCAAQAPECIWRTCWQDRPGAPVWFPAWTFEELCHLPQGKGGGAVIRQHPESVRYVPAQNGRELTDVDTPYCLARLEAGGTPIKF